MNNQTFSLFDNSKLNYCLKQHKEMYQNMANNPIR